jgi:hypothetical protein
MIDEAFGLDLRPGDGSRFARDWGGPDTRSLRAGSDSLKPWCKD